ncbi:MAG: hypothetical protein WBX25_10750, partial [Rhodomicrobium sp.]
RENASQAVLAVFMNVAVSTVSQWEHGERHPTGAAPEASACRQAPRPRSASVRQLSRLARLKEVFFIRRQIQESPPGKHSRFHFGRL